MALKAYFLSDIHLTSIEEPNAQRLLNFFRSLRSIEDITHLFLLGDIFDLWIADHFYFVNKFSEIIQEFKRLHALGVEIHYFEGNHDLYLERFFGNELGFHIHTEPKYFQLDRFRVRIEHGDQMDPYDRGYRFLRWLLRTPAMMWIAPRLPSRFVVWLGERMSKTSREYTTSIKTLSKKRATEIIRLHALRAFVERPFDFLLCGHIHVDYDYQVPESDSARVLNLGSWHDHPRAALITGEGLTPNVLS